MDTQGAMKSLPVKSWGEFTTTRALIPTLIFDYITRITDIQQHWLG